MEESRVLLAERVSLQVYLGKTRPILGLKVMFHFPFKKKNGEGGLWLEILGST